MDPSASKASLIPRRDPVFTLAWFVALAAGIAPLWAGRHLPLVDLPQHLHLISVLHRLDDPTTLYPQLFEARGELTPYLGYYYLVSLLNWLLPLDVANRVFLSAYVAGMPLAMAFLLRSLGRPTWPALLALPFAYGDSFAWGFVNYVSALPLTFLTLGLFVRTLTSPLHRVRWAVALAIALCAVLLFHVQAFAYLGLALPFLLLTTRVPEDAAPAKAGDTALDRLLRPRLPALVGVLPGVALFIAWFGGRLGQPAEIAYGQPWKAWGPMFSPQNLAWKGRVQHPAPFPEVMESHVRQNASELPQVLANFLRDGSDRYALYATAVVGVIALGLGAFSRFGPLRDQTAGLARASGGGVERWRLLVLGLLALLMYLTFPFDIRGYVYYLNTRYAHLALPLLVGALPLLPLVFRRVMVIAAAVVALVLAVPLVRAFSEFNAEFAAVDQLAGHTAGKPRVMGLMFSTGSRVMTHPVFLHAGAELARAGGGISNFSFALTPHSPLKYRGDPPPTFASEWRPGDFSMQQHGYAYDHFLVRGRHPQQIFGPLLGSELVLAAEREGFFLVRRR